MVKKITPKKKRRPKGKNAFTESVLAIFANSPLRAFNYKQVSAQLRISDKASKDLVSTILVELLESGTIIEIKPGKYKLHEKYLDSGHASQYITGIVDMKQTGKAYILNDEGGEDIFISANNTYHSLNGDRVKVFLFPKRKGRKTEGQIIEILQRAKKQYVGTLAISKQFGFLIPDHKSMPVDIFIPLKELKGARNGQKAIVRISEWPEHSKNPFGTIVKVLGTPGDNDVEMQSILAEYDFPLSFPDNVIKEALKIKQEISRRESANRKDFRDVFTITIDPPDAKDFDDALSLRLLENGHYEVGIHIADVSFYVPQDGIIDKEAFKRATSIYMVDRVIPMLPEELSNNVCSLSPNEDKLCFSMVFELDDNARIHDQWIGRTMINSNRRFNYEEVQGIIESGNGEYSKEILILHDLASKLREERFRNGSFNFETQEVKFTLDEKGKPLSVYIKEQKESNKLVETLCCWLTDGWLN